MPFYFFAQAYTPQDLSNAGFRCDEIELYRMKTCRYAGYITAFKGAAAELLLRIYLPGTGQII